MDNKWKPTYEPGTLMIGNITIARIKTRQLVLVVRGPLPDTKLNIHKVYNFKTGAVQAYMPDGEEEQVE